MLIAYNIITSNLSVDYQYFDSQEVFGYNITANYTLKFDDIAFTNEAGVLITGREAIKEVYNQQNITARIGADEFTNGRVTKIDFDSSALVGSGDVSITIEQSKRLNDYSATTFAKYIPSPQFLESFSEDYSFSRQGNTYSYTRNVSIAYRQDAGDQFLHNAKNFLTNFYHGARPAYGYQADGISENATFDQKLYGTLEESIDLIGLTVSLSEKFDSSFIEADANVSKAITQKTGIDQQGYKTKSIDVEFTALRRDAQNVITQAMADTIDSIVADEGSEFGTPVSISKGIAKDSRKGSLTVTFSTNPTTSSGNTITYSCNQTKNGSFQDYTFTARYASTGPNNHKRFQNARDYWSSEPVVMATKIPTLFPEVSSVFEKARSTKFDYTQGTIEETTTFTTDDSFDNSGLPDGILMFKLQLQKNNKVHRIEKVKDIQSLDEKIVIGEESIGIDGLRTIGSATVTAIAVSVPEYGLYHGKDFLNTKTSEINAMLEEDVYYTQSDVTTIDIGAGTTQRVINYIFP